MRAKIAVVLFAIGLAACRQPGPTVGSPAPAGAAMSKTTVGAPIATGSLLGSQLGKSLSEADVADADRTTQAALETGRSGRPLPWRNEQSGASGTVVPRNSYKTADGTQCRDFQQTVTVGGQTQQIYGTACKQQDGSWRIVP